MPNIVDLSCQCGAVKGKLNVVKGAFFHVKCYCCDCQQFARYLNTNTMVLDENGGTEIFQTYPAYIEITQGQENIACLQLKEKGLYRWYTTCCNTPFSNTLGSPKIPFVGIPVILMQFRDESEKLNILGPLSLKAFGKYAIGEMPKDAHLTFPLSFMPKMLRFMLKGFVSKKNNPSPFFKDGKPIVRAKVL